MHTSSWKHSRARYGVAGQMLLIADLSIKKILQCERTKTEFKKYHSA